MRFGWFAQVNCESRRRAAALFLAFCMLFSFLPVSRIVAVDETEAVISEPTAAPETMGETSAEPPETAASETSAEPPETAETTAAETADTTAPAPPAAETTAAERTDEPEIEPTETAAPESTAEPTETTAPAETTATSSQESTEPKETTASAATTNAADTPAETTASAGAAETAATAASDDPNADDPEIGLLASSDYTVNDAATFQCYAAVDGKWQVVGTLKSNLKYDFSSLWYQKRYIVYPDEVETVYGAFGFDAESYAGEHFFPHTDTNGPDEVWADAYPLYNAEKGTYRILGSARTLIYLYYLPANIEGSPDYIPSSFLTSDQAVIDANNFYSLEAYDPGRLFDADTLPEKRYVFHGETMSITLPYDPDIQWIPEDPNTEEKIDLEGVIDEAAGTITFTMENAAQSLRLHAKTDLIFVVYHAGLTDSLVKLGQFYPDRQQITEDGSVRGQLTYTDRLSFSGDGTYTVRGIDNDRAKIALTNDASGRSLYYSFQGWRVGSGEDALILQPGDTLTEKNIDKYLIAMGAEAGSDLELHAVWEAYDNNGRLTTLNFYVNINCEIMDNMSDGIQPTPTYDYTQSIYTTRLFGSDAITEPGDVMLIAPPTAADTAYEVDAILRAGTTVPIRGTLIEAMPSEEAVLAFIRASNKVITLDGEVIPHDQITSEHFKLRWYSLKYEKSDGWHVDGVLVAKAARLTVAKTFAGDDEAIAEAKKQFYITIAHDEDGTTVRDYILRLDESDNVTTDGEAGYVNYDEATDTYLWSVPVRKGRTYTVAEHGYALEDDIRWHHSNRVEVINCPEAAPWANGTSATVTADSYPNDLPEKAVQTVAFRNLYVQAGLLTVFKSDINTGNGLRNVTFRISRADGTSMQLWQMPGTNRYSSDTTAPDEGYTFLVPYNAATTDENGYFYVKLAVGEYFLDETLPIGYEGASRMRVSVTDDGEVEIAVAVTAGDHPPEGGWVEGVGTPILTVKNRSKLLTEVKAVKNWDNTDEADRLPVTVELWCNDAKMVGDIYTQTLSAENDWTYTWYNLPLFADGDYARYALREVRIGDTAYDPSAGSSGYADYLVSFDAPLYREGAGSDYGSSAVWQDADGKWHYADHMLLTVHNSESRGIISFTKVSETGIALPDAGFTLYADAACTEVIEHVWSNENGFVAFSPVSAGTYYMRETDTPHGYKQNSTLYRVVLRGGVATITATDDAAAAQLSQIVNISIARLVLQKTDFSGAPLRDAVFRLSGDTVLPSTYTVGEDGIVTIPELPNGNYLLEEVTAPKGYRRRTAPIPFRVHDGTIELTSDDEGRFFELTHVSGYTYRLTVRNEALFTIPTVGGTGIYPLTLIGTVLMCAAAAALLLLRRRDRAGDDPDADDKKAADDKKNSN